MTQERKNPYHGGNDPFVCVNCGLAVQPLVHGGQRNHCPRCLCSQHVDGPVPGDRAADCGGIMRPIAVERSAKKGWVIIQECAKCGLIRRNKAATDDPAQPDDFAELLRIAEHGPDRGLRRATWEKGQTRRAR
ncbi:MAG: RNHCP domain-containing protein [Armatimonadetes bacterium]|nr:RNHCP domain-containing protein [Armatimonadota bacterium]